MRCCCSVSEVAVRTSRESSRSFMMGILRSIMIVIKEEITEVNQLVK